MTRNDYDPYGRLTRVSAGLSQEPGGQWRANVDADQLNGYLEYRPPTRRGGAAAAGGRVYARLSRLSLPKSDVDQVESLLDPVHFRLHLQFGESK